MLEVGSRAFEFSLEGIGGKKRSLSDFRGNWVVLFFYPKDGTKG